MVGKTAQNVNGDGGINVADCAKWSQSVRSGQGKVAHHFRTELCHVLVFFASLPSFICFGP